MSIDYEELQEIAWNAPDVKNLLIERKQIEADYHKDTTYNKLDYTPKPSFDKSPPRTYTNDKSKDKGSEQHFRQRLKDNANKIEKALHKHCKEAGLEPLIEKYQEFSAIELPTFIEKGHDLTIKEREIRQAEKLKEHKQNSFDTNTTAKEKRIKKNKTLDQSQEMLNDFRQEKKSSKSEMTKETFNNSQELMKNKLKKPEKSKNQETIKEKNSQLDQAYEKLRESQFKENQKEIEQKRDRGFKR